MLFKSHFWDLGAGAEPLSDGGAPPRDRCPAYIAALVCARNVTVQRRQQPGAEPVFTAVRPNILLRLDEARRVNAALYAAGLYPAVSDPPPRDAVLERRVTPQFTAARTAMLRSVHEEVEATPAMARPTAVTSRTRLERFGWTTEDYLEFGSSPPPTPSPSPPPAPEVAPSNEITILAFICKGLSRCPDPDKALSW